MLPESCKVFLTCAKLYFCFLTSGASVSTFLALAMLVKTKAIPPAMEMAVSMGVIPTFIPEAMALEIPEAVSKAI